MLAPSVLLTQDLTATKVVGIEYPPLAIAARVFGTVKIKCILTAQGTVVSTEILEAVADVEDPALKEARSKGVRDLLGKAAQENAMKWTFIVQDKSESPFTVLTYRFGFEIKESSPDYRSRSRYVFDYPSTIRVIAVLPPPQI
jgi:hypothetical protein